MRIALVFNRFRSDGGTERITLNAFDALARDDVEWLVLARNWGGPREDKVRFIRCNPPALGRSWRLVAFLRAVRGRLRGLDADFVQAQVHLPEADIYRADGGAHAEWMAQRRRATGRLKRLWQALEPYHRLKVRMERRMYAGSRLRAVICNSEMVRDDIRRHYPECRARLEVIDYGIDLEHYRCTDEGRARARQARQELGIPSDARVFTYVGSGFERKGLATAIRALAWERTGAHLIAVGRDSRLWWYRLLAYRLGVAGRVHFTGPQADVRPYLWTANALVHPALYEAFGLVILEAMAAGKPVIASERTGAALALVTGDATGRLLDALDVAGFAEAMAAMPAAGSEDAEVSGQACEAAASRFSLPRMRENLLAFYSQLSVEAARL